MGDGSVKWTTLEHQAVLFPPPYIPLPKGIKMKYDGASGRSTGYKTSWAC
jgi:DNA topoisomerase-1